MNNDLARLAMAEMTVARIDLLETLRRVGPCSLFALAMAAQRDSSNVRTDVVRLSELGLIQQTDDGFVRVPFDPAELLSPPTTL